MFRIIVDGEISVQRRLDSEQPTPEQEAEALRIATQLQTLVDAAVEEANRQIALVQP